MLKEKIQGFIAKKTEGNTKRKIENLIVFLIILIVTIVAINMIWKEDKKEAKQEENANAYKTSGGTRKITETDTSKEIIYKEENGEKVPITEQIIMAKIEGAVITAKGAGNANVKANIIQAVEAATGIPTHKIQVFEMN